ncbi:hypothetical protein [Calothrix sp. 336/3]
MLDHSHSHSRISALSLITSGDRLYLQERSLTPTPTQPFPPTG